MPNTKVNCSASCGLTGADDVSTEVCQFEQTCQMMGGVDSGGKGWDMGRERKGEVCAFLSVCCEPKVSLKYEIFTNKLHQCTLCGSHWTCVCVKSPVSEFNSSLSV